MSDLNTWDTTAANNNSAPPNGWPEGMNYSDVNNSARENMASIARFYSDNNGSLSLGGTTAAATVTLNAGYAAYFTGLTFRAIATANMAASSTINVNAIGAANLVDHSGTAIGAGIIVSGRVYDFYYNGTAMVVLNTGQEIIQDIVGAMVSGNTETGITVTYQDGDGTIDFVISGLTTSEFASANVSQWTNDAGYVTSTLTTEQIEDIVGAMVSGNTETGITVTYDDTNGKIDFSAAGGVAAEDVEDIVGAMLSGNTETGITVTYDDPGGKIDFVITGLTTTQFASANVSQWTNDSGYITATLTTEQVEDIVGAMVSGNTEGGITVTYQDGDGTIDFVVGSLTTAHFSSANISQWTNDAGYISATLTDEQVQDIVGAMVSSNTETGISVTYQDADGTVDFVVTGLTTSQFASANISQWTNNSGYITATLSNEQVEDIVGAMLSGNTETGIDVTYQDADGTIDFAINTTYLAGLEITQFNVTSSTADPSGTPDDGELWIKREA